MEAIFSGVGSFVPFILLIGVVVMVHEFGHYFAGRFFGAGVESFAFGFGDSIIEGTDKRGTRWRVNWLPLGGFVKFVDEVQTPGDAEGSKEASERPQPIGKPYSALQPWQRVIVSLAGPMINFLFAIIVFAIFAMTIGQDVYERVTIQTVIANGPADKAGFKQGDDIVWVAGQRVQTPQDVMLAVQYSADEPVNFVVARQGREIDLTVTPRRTLTRNEALDVEEEIGRIDIGFAAPTGRERLNPVDALAYGANQTVVLIRTTIKVIVRLVTGKDSFDKMRGPIGIGDFADKLVDAHMKQVDVPLSEKIFSAARSLLWMSALFSVSIGFFNLLPIPMLDGYHALLGIYETVAGTAVSMKVQDYLLRGGLAVIGLFFIAVTLNDLKRTGVLEVFARLLS